MSDKLRYEIVTPEALHSSATAEQVVVPGAEGDFGVLNGHAPVLSTLRPGVITILGGENGDEQIFVKGGLAQVAPDGLTILTEESIRLDRVDREWLARSRAAAESALAAAESEAERARRADELAALQALEAAL